MVSSTLSWLRTEMNGEVNIEGIGIHTKDMMGQTSHASDLIDMRSPDLAILAKSLLNAATSCYIMIQAGLSTFNHD